MHGRVKHLAARAILAVTLATVGFTGPNPVASAQWDPIPYSLDATRYDDVYYGVTWKYWGHTDIGFRIKDQNHRVVGTAGPDQRSTNLPPLTPNTYYVLRVCAVYRNLSLTEYDACSEGQGGSVQFTTGPGASSPPPPPPPPPPPLPTPQPLTRPTNLQVTPLTATTASVTWQTGPWPDEEFEYSLGIRCKDQATGQACYNTSTDNRIARPLRLSATSFRLTRLEAGHRYGIGICKTVSFQTNSANILRPYCTDVEFEMPAHRADERSRCVETGTCEIPPAAETRVQGCQLTGSCATPPTATPTPPPAPPTPPPPATTRSGRGCQLTGTC